MQIYCSHVTENIKTEGLHRLRNPIMKWFGLIREALL